MLYDTNIIKKKIIDELKRDDVFRRQVVIVLMEDELIRRYLREEMNK